jgi:hypothetical protein
LSERPTVATPSAEYNAASETWKLPRTLMGGTRAMRAARTSYLPKEPAEDDQDYDRRLHRSTLFNGFRKTVRDMAGKVFAKPIALGEDMPEQAVEWAENIDLAGRNLTVFSHAVFRDALQTGIGFILVDMPAPLPEGATRADEQAEGRRPYFVHVKAEQVIGWKSDLIAGKETLTQVRIKECVSEDNGDWHEKEVEQIRVITAGQGTMPASWQIWRKKEGAHGHGDEWFLHEEGSTSLPQITLAPVYVNRTGFMQGQPPLEDLADLNVAHWQSASDQRNILHVARVPILFGAGIPQDDKGQFLISIGSITCSSDASAKLGWVEHSGAAIGSGSEDLKALEFQMQTMGLELLVPRAGDETATGRAIDQAAMHAPLALMALALQDALEQAFGFAMEYVGEEAGLGGQLTVNTDFGVSMRDAADLTALQAAQAAGIISKETFILELKRRGVLSDSVDPEDEIAKAEDEAPDLMGDPMALGGKPGDDLSGAFDASLLDDDEKAAA